MSTIYVDLDGTIADLHTPWCEWISKRIGIPFKKEDVTQWDMVASVLDAMTRVGQEIPKEEAKKIVWSFLDVKGVFRSLEPYPDAVETIKLWEQAGRDIVVASSPAWRAESASEKIEWVREHLGKTPIVLLKDKWRLSQPNDTLIDDSPEQLKAWRYRRVMMDQPWNRAFNFLDSHSDRWFDWSGVRDLALSELVYEDND